jgi:hypothetical protein
MEYPVEFIPDIPVKLRSYKPILRRQHIVIFWIAGAGGVKKANRTFGRNRHHKIFRIKII